MDMTWFGQEDLGPEDGKEAENASSSLIFRLKITHVAHKYSTVFPITVKSSNRKCPFLGRTAGLNAS